MTTRGEERLLLDTHVLLWALENSDRLGDKARSVIAQGVVFVSAASFWELAIKQSLGKLQFPDNLQFPDKLEELVVASGASLVEITAGHALGVASVETPHRDPFDRLLLSQCQIEGLTLVTADAALLGVVGVSVIDARR